MRYTNGRNSILSFFAMLLLGYFVILPIVIASVLDIFGSFESVINSLIDILPFGNVYYQFSISLINTWFGLAIENNQPSDFFTFAYVFNELTKGVFTLIAYEALNTGSGMLLGLQYSKKFWNKAKFVLVEVFNAIIAASVAPFLINLVLSPLESNSNMITTILQILAFIVVHLGGFFFFKLLYSFPYIIAFSFYLIKIILVPAIKISVVYILILTVMLIFKYNLYYAFFDYMAPALLILILLGSIEMMFDSVFNSYKL